MSDSGKPAAAAAAAKVSDADVARRLQAMDQLTSIFGFSPEVAAQGMDAVIVGDDSYDVVTQAYNYILDHGLGVDQGGPVTPMETCPHVHPSLMVQQLTLDQLPSSLEHTVCSHDSQQQVGATTRTAAHLKSATDETGGCPAGENWLCLTCGCIRCSRYVNAHALEHYQATKGDGDDTAASSSTTGHAIAVSLADLSVWCHACQSYLVAHKNPELQPIVERLEEIKFPSSSNMPQAPNDEVCQSPKRQASKKQRLGADSGDDVSGEFENVWISVYHRDQNISTYHLLCFVEEDQEKHGEPVADEIDLMEALRAAAAAQGIPFELLLQQAQAYGDDDDDDSDKEEILYPFDDRPNSLEKLANFITSDKCRRILILAGAGMSVSSGIPDFRSPDGLYATLDPRQLSATPQQQRLMCTDPSAALGLPMFLENPLPCLELTRVFVQGTRQQKWKPTLAHRFVELLHQKLGHKLVRLYTQNIDGLEDQCAGLPRDKVIAVHGSMDRAQCAKCKTESDFADFSDKVLRQIKDYTGQDATAPKHSTAIPCGACGEALMKPSVVLFGEGLPAAFFESSPTDVKDVDLLLIIGTSLRVAPANNLVQRVPKSALRVLINREPEGEHLGLNWDEAETDRDYFVAGDCEAVILDLMEHLGWMEELAPLLKYHKLPKSSADLLQAKLAQVDAAGVDESTDGAVSGEDDAP
jgi:NAD-dependent deacetylase sirtuin 2